MATIRMATIADLARLEQIENEADVILRSFLRPEAWSPAPSVQDRTGQVGFVLALAEQDEAHAVGFAHVLLVEGYAHLEQLSVLPTHGRRGNGRLLVEAAQAEAAALGTGRITLRTFAEVPWNAPFYARCGFVETVPETPFEWELVRVEEGLGLPRYGRRIQMTCDHFPAGAR